MADRASKFRRSVFSHRGPNHKAQRIGYWQEFLQTTCSVNKLYKAAMASRLNREIVLKVQHLLVGSCVQSGVGKRAKERCCGQCELHPGQMLPEAGYIGKEASNQSLTILKSLAECLL